MLFSFLVPVYNVEKYLEKCIQSLLLQKGCAYEIVLLDDGSTDTSGKICDRYAEEYPDKIRVVHKANEGLLMTRRRGFAEARGDWFICVDSDDYVSPDLLQSVVSTIKETDADMVMYNFTYFDENDIHTPSRIKMKNGELFEGIGKQHIYEKRLLTVDYNSMCLRAVKRDLIDFDTDYSSCGIRNMCEDAVQVLALYTNAKKIVYIDEPLYYYRKGIDSITAKYSMERWNASMRCHEYTKQYLKIWNVSDEVESRYYTKHLESLCNYVRWLFSAEENELPLSLEDMVGQLKQDDGFVTSRQKYQKEFAHSRYLSMIVPVLTRFVQSENIVGIRVILCLERWVLKFKRK